MTFIYKMNVAMQVVQYAAHHPQRGRVKWGTVIHRWGLKGLHCILAPTICPK